MRTGRYLYGLIRSAEDQDFGAIGLEHQGKPGRVHTVQVDGVAAIVSEYPVGEKILPLRKNLGPHHRVIQEVMKTATIVPASFGHVAKSEDDVARALRRNDGAVRAELDRVDGKVEMGLKVRWDVDNIFEYFVGLDPELAAFRDEIFGRSHAPTQAEKIDLGQMFERRVAQDREDQSERVVKAFQPLFSEVKVNPPGVPGAARRREELRGARLRGGRDLPGPVSVRLQRTVGAVSLRRARPPRCSGVRSDHGPAQRADPGSALGVPGGR